MSYESIVGADLQTAKSELEFPIARDNAIAEERLMDARKDVVIREDTNELLGLVSKRRPIVPFPEIMEWLVGEFENSGVDFKLQNSELTRRNEMFQNYVFDMGISTPDGQEISPMIIAKSSHVGTPLELVWGTFRFVCSNGVYVGETIDSLKVRARELKDLSVFSLRDEIKMSLDSMKFIGNRYKELADEAMEDYVYPFLGGENTPMAFRKMVLKSLEERDLVKLHTKKFKKDTLQSMRLENDTYLTIDGEPLFTMKEHKSAWDLYNVATEVATHNIHSISGKEASYHSISLAFTA